MTIDALEAMTLQQRDRLPLSPDCLLQGLPALQIDDTAAHYWMQRQPGVADSIAAGRRVSRLRRRRPFYRSWFYPAGRKVGTAQSGQTGIVRWQRMNSADPIAYRVGNSPAVCLYVKSSSPSTT